MTRRFLYVPLIILIFFGSCTSKNTSVTYHSSRPAWPDTMPIVMVGNWDGDPLFRNRRGGNPAWYNEEYDREYSEEAILKLRQMGVTMVITDLFKGFGLEAEKDQREYTERIIALCHRNGLKAGVYVGSTICYETFLLEEPDAKKWFVPDFMGKPVLWDTRQPFRKRVYFMHPGYVNYIRKVLRIAIVDLKVDLIHFDNTSERAEGPVFFHPQAKKDFRAFLGRNYTPQELKERLGFSDVSHVEPPLFSEPASRINEPLFQLWTDFRCHQLAKFYGEMERYIHQLNPLVVVENNPCYGLSGVNTEWSCGMYYPDLLAHTSIIWSEEGDEAGYSSEGILISKIRSYKMANHLKNKIFTYTGESPLQIAEAMAYNRQCLGMIGGVLAGYELEERREDIGFDNPYALGAYTEDPEIRQKKADYVRYFHDNFRYYRDIDNIADVAVLHSYSTLAFNNDRPYQSLYLFEQTLIQGKVLFDIIYDEDLKDLSGYKVLVLADVECLSDEKQELIRNFVKNGGGLVATEHTSLYTEFRNRKRDFGMKDLFQTSAPRYLLSRYPESILDVPVLKNNSGDGRVVYIPEVIPAIPKPPTEEMRSHYWKLPLNWKELIESVKWAAGDSLLIETDAPETITLELTSKQDQSSIMLHLLNYNSRQDTIMKDIKFGLNIFKGKEVASIKMLSPDLPGACDINFQLTGNILTFIVPELIIYDLIVIRLKNK